MRCRPQRCGRKYLSTKTLSIIRFPVLMFADDAVHLRFTFQRLLSCSKTRPTIPWTSASTSLHLELGVRGSGLSTSTSLHLSSTPIAPVSPVSSQRAFRENIIITSWTYSKELVSLYFAPSSFNVPTRRTSHPPWNSPLSHLSRVTVPFLSSSLPNFIPISRKFPSSEQYATGQNSRDVTSHRSPSLGFHVPLDLPSSNCARFCP